HRRPERVRAVVRRSGLHVLDRPDRGGRHRHCRPARPWSCVPRQADRTACTAQRSQPARLERLMASAGELRAVIDGTDPGWLDGVDPALLPAARNSALGRRLMARTLAGGTAATLLAPSPKPALDRVLKRWPQVKLRSLV